MKFKQRCLAVGILVCSLMATPAVSDGPHDLPISDLLMDQALATWFSGRSKADITSEYLGVETDLSSAQLIQLKQAVMSQEILAAAAQMEGLALPENTQSDDPRELTLQLASMYENLLRDRFAPTEAQLRDLYEREILAIVEGQENAIVPEFSDVEEVLRRSYVLKRIDDHYRTLLIGVSTVGVSGGHAEHDMSAHAGHMPVGETIPERLAYMTAHFIAGVALYRDGDAQASLGHLAHPFSEMHRAEWTGLDAYGFDQELFKQVHEMVAQEHAPEMVEPAIEAALDNLYHTAHMAETPAMDTANFILSVAQIEYEKAVDGSVVIDQKIYQDIFGYLTVAQYWLVAAEVDSSELDQLIEMQRQGHTIDAEEFRSSVSGLIDQN